jgi:protein-S-isoprenylcysteine O-methyltransferase Ste14
MRYLAGGQLLMVAGLCGYLAVDSLSNLGASYQDNPPSIWIVGGLLYALVGLAAVLWALRLTRRR